MSFVRRSSARAAPSIASANGAGRSAKDTPRGMGSVCGSMATKLSALPGLRLSGSGRRRPSGCVWWLPGPGVLRCAQTDGRRRSARIGEVRPVADACDLNSLRARPPAPGGAQGSPHAAGLKIPHAKSRVGRERKVERVREVLVRRAWRARRVESRGPCNRGRREAQVTSSRIASRGGKSRAERV